MVYYIRTCVHCKGQAVVSRHYCARGEYNTYIPIYIFYRYTGHRRRSGCQTIKNKTRLCPEKIDFYFAYSFIIIFFVFRYGFFLTLYLYNTYSYCCLIIRLGLLSYKYVYTILLYSKQIYTFMYLTYSCTTVCIWFILYFFANHP